MLQPEPITESGSNGHCAIKCPLQPIEECAGTGFVSHSSRCAECQTARSLWVALSNTGLGDIFNIRCSDHPRRAQTDDEEDPETAKLEMIPKKEYQHAARTLEQIRSNLEHHQDENERLQKELDQITTERDDALQELAEAKNKFNRQVAENEGEDGPKF